MRPVWSPPMEARNADGRPESGARTVMRSRNSNIHIQPYSTFSSRPFPSAQFRSPLVTSYQIGSPLLPSSRVKSTPIFSARGTSTPLPSTPIISSQFLYLPEASASGRTYDYFQHSSSCQAGSSLVAVSPILSSRLKSIPVSSSLVQSSLIMRAWRPRPPGGTYIVFSTALHVGSPLVAALRIYLDPFNSRPVLSGPIESCVFPEASASGTDLYVSARLFMSDRVISCLVASGPVNSRLVDSILVMRTRRLRPPGRPYKREREKSQ
jgi:hypothetical protein